MSTVFQIPLTAKAQTIDIALAGTTYTITCRWNEQIGWCLDISNTATKQPLISCLPVVTGCDLLQQFKYCGLGGQLIAFTAGDNSGAIPTFRNLGVDSGIYFVVLDD
jgi:hypothetical protein